MSQMGKRPVVINDFQSFILGVTQLDSRRQTGLLAAHAGLWVTSQEAHSHLEGGVQVTAPNTQSPELGVGDALQRKMKMFTL